MRRLGFGSLRGEGRRSETGTQCACGSNPDDQEEPLSRGKKKIQRNITARSSRVRKRTAAAVEKKEKKKNVLQGQDSDVVPPGEDRRLAAQGETSDAAGEGSTRCQGGTLMRRGIGYAIKTGIATLPTQSMQAVQRGKAIGVALRCLGRFRGAAAEPQFTGELQESRAGTGIERRW